MAAGGLLSANTNRAPVAHGKAAEAAVGNDDILIVSVTGVARVDGHRGGSGDGAALEGVEGGDALCGSGGGEPGEEGGQGEKVLGELHF